MYQVADVLQTIHEHALTVAILVLFGWVGGFVQIGEALRLGFRERVAGQPLGTTMVMLAHDLTFALNYEFYVRDVGHVMFVLFWIGMVLSNFVEIVMLCQWIRYQDTGLPIAIVCLIISVFQAMAFALWWWARSLIDDPLGMVGLVAVQVGAVVFGVPMLLGRRTASGSSRVFIWATVLGPGSLGFLFIPYLVPVIGSQWQFWLVVATTLLCAMAFALLYEMLRRNDARTDVGRTTLASPRL